MRWPPYLGLPILWLYLGPPIFRPIGGRDAMASLEGQFDVWNVMRLGWWAVFGVLAAIMIYRNQHLVRAFVRTMPQLLLWILVWMSSLVVSSAYSPSPLFTLANAGMMVMLVTAAFDVGLRLYGRIIDVETVLRGLHVFSVALLGVMLLLFALDPMWVSTFSPRFGLRFGGGVVGDAALLASTVVFLSAYFLQRVPRRRMWWYGTTGVVGIVLVLLSQTRTAYIGLAVGFVYMFVQWYISASDRARAVAVGIVLVGVGLAPVAVLVADTVSGESTPAQAVRYLVRDQQTLATASGRTAVAGILLEQVGARPWGLGYSAGPRILLQTSFSELAEQGVHAEGIGNAHNIFLEVLGGSGVLGLFAYVAVIVWVVLNMHRGGGPVLVVRVLFVYVMIIGMTSSNGVLPFFQASVLMWFMVGSVAGLNGLGHVVPTVRAPWSVQPAPDVPALLGSGERSVRQ